MNDQQYTFVPAQPGWAAVLEGKRYPVAAWRADEDGDLIGMVADGDHFYLRPVTQVGTFYGYEYDGEWAG